MVTNLKALAVVLFFAIAVFWLCKNICLRFMSEADFYRRRNVWIALTVVAFCSPSFWLYALFAFPLMLWASNKDENPVALYVLLLHVIPPDGLELPAIFINRLFELNNYRILALAVLIPTAWRLLQTKDKSSFGDHKMVDRFMWGYFVLQLAQVISYEDITNTMRRGILLILDVLLLFYVVSRSCNNKKRITEVMAAYSLACAIFIPIAVFESLKLWLVYTGLTEVWGTRGSGGYLFRDGSLRALVSTGHSLQLGFLLAMAFGFWLYLSTHVQSNTQRILGSVVIWIALIAAYSRGPWLSAIVVFFAYIFFNPDGLQKLVKTLSVGFPVALIIVMSPFGSKIIDKLPFIGKVDSFNVDYRERIIDLSWVLIKEHPFLGDPFVFTRMESLRQGEGIIDIVNVYASTALFYGYVGLFLFLGPLIIGIISIWKQRRKVIKTDVDLSLIGAALLACILGTLLFIATASFMFGLPKIYYLLAGLAAAYGQLKQPVAQQYPGSNEQKGPQFVRNRKNLVLAHARPQQH